MTSYELHNLMKDVFNEEIMLLRKQGQEEYASGSDAFYNFKKQGEELDMDPKIVLWVHAMKHKSGIDSYLRGVKSQREDVRGRINDLIVYLFILRGIIEDEDSQEKMLAEKAKEQLKVQVKEMDKVTIGARSFGVQTGQEHEEEKSTTDQKESTSA